MRVQAVPLELNLAGIETRLACECSGSVHLLELNLAGIETRLVIGLAINSVKP